MIYLQPNFVCIGVWIKDCRYCWYSQDLTEWQMTPCMCFFARKLYFDCNCIEFLPKGPNDNKSLFLILYRHWISGCHYPNKWWSSSLTHISISWPKNTITQLNRTCFNIWEWFQANDALAYLTTNFNNAQNGMQDTGNALLKTVCTSRVFPKRQTLPIPK